MAFLVHIRSQSGERTTQHIANATEALQIVRAAVVDGMSVRVENDLGKAVSPSRLAIEARNAQKGLTTGSG